MKYLLCFGLSLLCLNAGLLNTTASPPCTLGIQANTNGTKTILIQAGAGTLYAIQAAGDLATPAWTSLCTNLTGLDGLATFCDLDATQHSVRFYRALLIPAVQPSEFTNAISAKGL